MAQKIIVTISPEGETEVKVEGCPGPSCKDLTKALEKALGNTSSDKTTPEYTQAVAKKAQVKR